MSFGPTFINTVLLGAAPEDKLRAGRTVGFGHVELWTRDVENAQGGVAAVRALADALGFGFTDYQVLLDFDGAPCDRRAAKRTEALAMLDTAAALGIATLLTPASTAPDCDPGRVAEDMAWLVDEARQRGLRIAYEGMAWSTVNYSLKRAWSVVRDLDPGHAGLVVDSYHLFVRGESPAVLDGIPSDRIFLVQFSDVAGRSRRTITSRSPATLASRRGTACCRSTGSSRRCGGSVMRGRSGWRYSTTNRKPNQPIRGQHIGRI